MKHVIQNQFLIPSVTLIVAAAMALFAPVAMAGGVKYSEGDKYVKLGGRIQMQYQMVDPDTGDSEDTTFFRRLRPYIEGSVHKDWKGKFQFDLGKAEDGNEVAIKDAYLQYKGIDNMKITIGNAYFPFSREALTSSKKQQLVERTFVGDHNYGTPDRQLGIHLTGSAADKKVTYGASVANGAIDPSTSKLDFDTLANKNDDFVEGYMVGGRVDVHPFGHLKMSQGDFKRELKATIGAGAFTWSNDDDVVNDGSDVDSVTGFEVSAALRASGFSADAQYNLFQAETVDGNTTAGLYENGETDLENYALEAGYMIMPRTVELVAGYQAQDADNYADAWTRTSVGANYFFKAHDIKLQTTYRVGENLKGVTDADANELFVQMQYVF
ncbi:MAG: porin [Desulfuromonadales bacterium]